MYSELSVDNYSLKRSVLRSSEQPNRNVAVTGSFSGSTKRCKIAHVIQNTAGKCLFEVYYSDRYLLIVLVVLSAICSVVVLFK